MKDFNTWNILKQEIHTTQRKTVFYKEREVYITHLGINIGFEEDGKKEGFSRPVLIIKRIGNLLFVVPMTTKWKVKSSFYYQLPNSYFNKDSWLILSQARVIDKKRLVRKIGTIHKEDFSSIKKSLKTLLL